MKRRLCWLWILAIPWACFAAPAAEALVEPGQGSAAEARAGADPADVEMIRRGLDATLSIVNLVQGANFRRKNNLECFVSGTPVETRDGPRPIEQVREGDWVLAWDEDAGELCWSRVEQTFVTPRQPIWRLTLKLPDGSEESLDCTPGHPFWADGEGWVSACHLQPGQDVATLSGPARVASVAPTGRNRTVYNFEVEGTHCYFVGTKGLLAHNGPCTETGSYTNTHASGKTYHGKGGRARSQASGRRVEAETGDLHIATDWKPAKNNLKSEAFKDEARRLRADGGPNSSKNYNKRNSPGEALLQKDGE